MRFGEADAMKKAEEALAVLTQEREAQQCRVSELRLLQAELGRQAVVVQAIRAEGKRLQSAHMAECQRADAAETAAKDRQEEADKLRSSIADASKQAEKALSAANADKQALLEIIMVRQNDASSRSSATDAEQQRLAALQGECERLRAEHAAAERMAACLRQETELLRADGSEAWGGGRGGRGEQQTLAALQEECERRAASEQRVKEETRAFFNKLRNDCNAQAEVVHGELVETMQLLANQKAEAKAGLAVSREQQDALQKELEVLKADIASEAAGAEAFYHQAAKNVTAEVEQLQAACAAEAQRADAAETAAKASQEEAERMRSGEADAMKQAEEALAVLTQEREALQAELGQTEAEQQVVVAMRAEFERLQSAHMAESQRADAAETAAKDRQEEANRLRSSLADASKRAEEALSAANADKQAMQEQITDLQNDVSSRSSAADAEQQRLSALQEECERLKAGQAAAEAMAAEPWQETELGQKTFQQGIEEFKAEVARLRSAHAGEAERAVSAESAARARIACSGGEDALQQAEATLTAIRQEKETLQAERDQLKADFASKTAAREAEIQQLQSELVAASERDDAAGIMAHRLQGEVERLYLLPL